MKWIIKLKEDVNEFHITIKNIKKLVTIRIIII